jgi:hypothetical protein
MSQRDFAAHLVRVKRFTRFPAVWPGKIRAGFEPPTQTHAIKLLVLCPARQVYDCFVRAKTGRRGQAQADHPGCVAQNGELRAKVDLNIS